MTMHLAQIHRGWSLWKSLRLRSAGFPASRVLALASPEASRAIEEMQRLEALLASKRQLCASICREAWVASENGDLKGALGRALKELRKDHVPQPIDRAPDAVTCAIGELVEAAGQLEAAERRAHAVFDDATTRVAAILREAARDPRFRLAVTWQNRHAVRTGLDALLRQPATARDRSVRKHEWLIASYLQRYCTKNETIGFFGPVAWASFDGRRHGVEVTSGRPFLSQRTVYFELWAIDALAERLAEDLDIRRSLAPRRMPTVRLDGTQIHLPDGKTVELPAEFARLFALIDGDRSAQTIADTLLADPEAELGGEDDVFSLLEQLVEKRLAVWGFELPVWDWRPERALGEAIAKIADETARQHARAALGDLCAARDHLARAGEDAEALDRAFSALEENFTRLTSRAASRREGQIYAGRTIVYEDCVRNVEATLGSELLARLGKPLSLVLESARWYCYQIGEKVRALCVDAYRDLRARAGGEAVDYLAFWKQIAPSLGTGDAASELIGAVSRELQSKWAQIFSIDASSKEIVVSSSAIEARVHEAFPAPRPGWPLARYHSPDVMIAARSIEAINRGEYRFVLGEIHVSCNSLFGQIGIAQHADPTELFAAARRDVSGLSVTPVESKAHALRADYLPIKPDDPQLEIGSTRAALPRDRVLEAQELIVEESEGGLVVRTRDGRYAFEVVSFIEQYLTFAAHSAFKLLPFLPHTPRVSIDDMVIERERWTFSKTDVAFVRIEDPFERFAAARRWAIAHALPRWMFARVAEEKKPFFVDLESPMFIELFTRQVRKSSSVVVSEMLPSLEELWLVDSAGESYTSELRIAALDPHAFGLGRSRGK